MTQDPFYKPDASAYYPTPQAPPPKKNNTILIIIVVAVALLLCCCVAAAVWGLWTYGDLMIEQLGLDTLSILIR